MNDPSCVVAACDRAVHVKKYGWCNSHYQRWRKYGDPLGARDTPQYTQECAFEGCPAPRRYDQLCMGHYNQLRKAGQLSPLRRVTNPRIRDADGNKQCRRCETWQQESSFCTNKARPDKLAAYCRRCERDKALIHNYGITVDQHEKMLASQGGGCAICGGQTKDGRAFFVDHDHSCCPGQRTCGSCIRGLLCGDCNLGIGYFDDDISRITVAIAYLRAAAETRDAGAT